jgi:hypothetical protein
MKNHIRKTIIAALVITPVASLSQALLFTAEAEDRGPGFLFDITSLFKESDLEFQGIYYRFSHWGNTAPIVRMYYKVGSYVGHENNSASWTLLGEQVVTGQIFNYQLRLMDFELPPLPFGQTYGIYTVVMNWDHSNEEEVAGMVFERRDVTTDNGYLRFTGGSIMLSPTLFGGDPFTSQAFPGRSWAGMIATIPEPTTVITLAAGMGLLALRKRRR